RSKQRLRWLIRPEPLRRNLLVQYALVGRVLIDEVHAIRPFGDNVGILHLANRPQGRRPKGNLAVSIWLKVVWLGTVGPRHAGCSAAGSHGNLGVRSGRQRCFAMLWTTIARKC